MTAEMAELGAAPPRPARAPLGRALRALLAILGLTVVVWALVAGWPQVVHAVSALRGANVPLMATAVVAQAGALAMLGRVYRQCVATSGGRVSERDAAGVALRAYAVSRMLPGGGAAAAIFAAQRLRRGGVADGPAVTGVALTGVITMTTLAMIVGLMALQAAADPWWAVAILGVGAFAGAGGGLLLLHAGGARRRLLGVAGRLRRRPALAVWASALEALAERPPRPGAVAAAVGCSAAAWVCELAALWLAIAAVGATLPMSTVALALGAANAAVAVPHTPGGIGVVEVAMTGTFAALGVQAAPALAGVLAYRLVAFWVPVAVGASLLACDGVRRRRRS